MTDKKLSRVFSFRIPADIAEELELAVRVSAKDKTAWIMGGVLDKLGKSSQALSNLTSCRMAAC